MKFLKLEYNTIFITDTAFYRNNHYHKMIDRIDTLNFDKISEIVKELY
jgi:hypothetical protein